MRGPWSFVLMSLLLLTNGCASTGQARSVETSGFLQDLYPRMHKGKEGEALLVYKNPHGIVPVHKATKIMLDPVLIYRGQDIKMNGMPQEQAQVMADTFYALIYQELSKDYEMVKQPGPDTLRAQVAIVHMEQSYPALDIISTIPAPLNVLALGSALKAVATGKPAFTGEAAVEAKVSDAQTGEVLAAFVDRRVGKKKLDAESFNSWADVYSYSFILEDGTGSMQVDVAGSCHGPGVVLVVDEGDKVLVEAVIEELTGSDGRSSIRASAKELQRVGK